MLKPLWPVVFSSALLVACNQESPAPAEQPAAAPKPDTPLPTTGTPEFDISQLDGKYASENGELDIQMTEGMVIFNLLVVSEQGRTGEAAGEVILNNDLKGGRYHNPENNCSIVFSFAHEQLTLDQQGTCDMGMGVTATGDYHSQALANAARVEGETGQTLGSLFYATDDVTYQQYCQAGMEEYSGRIICIAREKSGKDSSDIVHIFAGDYAGPDGELPPLDTAKGFSIVETR